MNRGNRNGPVSQELAELNFHIQDEKKEIRGEGQGVSKEDDLQVNEGRQQRSEEQLQWPLGCWEGFQPHRSLKVLLVENDDSTRHVVTALLRKSGYLVTAVANGIHAWKILKDLTTHVDLVLTEVVMPCFSGIGLLSKIMGHKTCKNIPVIMMSSQDSMSMVFSCLSRGAVDFLVKPIRKNELRNLWQHVWRRCLSSSGSASESSIQTQKSTTSTSVEKADKNTDSNGEDDNGSVGLNARNPDDNGSSSEISQVIHLRPEAFCNDWVPAITTRECEGQDEELDAVVMGKDLKTAVPRIPNVQLEEPKEKQLTDIAGTNKDKHSEMNLMKGDEQLEKRQPELNNENQNGEFRNQAVDLMGVTTNSTTDPQIQCIMFDIPNGVYKVSDVRDKAIHDSKEIPFLELSLKTQKDIQDTRSNAHDPNVLRQSDLSAFSRYSLRTTSNSAPAGNVGSYSPLDKSSEASKEKSLQNFPSNSNSTPLYQHSDGFSNNNGMGSTTNNFLTKQRALEEKPEPRSTIKCLHPASAFQPEHNSLISLSQPIIQGKADTANGNTILAQGRGMNQQVQVQHHHHHYHHYHHVHNMPQHQQLPNHDDLSLKSLAAAAPQCGSSDVLGAPMEGNDGNHSLHGSGSGSNHSSNGTNGCSFAINSRGTNMDSDNGVVGKEGTILAIGDGSRSGVDQNHLSQREAALNKFHQKRKERCFEKKVRYQSRKKLADERPRVRGQFVRQGMHENKDKDTHC